jgi:predicted NodU family carbamoyl transferase
MIRVGWRQPYMLMVADVLRHFNERTGCPVIVNTSFNVRGEPIVCTPEDAFRCFMDTKMEVLAIGNCFCLAGAAIETVAPTRVPFLFAITLMKPSRSSSQIARSGS